jgi:PPM family protein phosphatase
VIAFAGMSRKRSGDDANEDSIGWNVERKLALVADGMGGHAKGEVASAIAKESLLADPNGSLAEGALTAHAKILEYAGAHPEAKGMGCTLVALTVTDRQACIVWIGDSRAYLLRGRHLRALTKDHTRAEVAREEVGLSETQVRQHPGHNFLTQALGQPTPVPSLKKTSLHRGDRLMLCSDGLSGVLRDPEIAEVMNGHGDLESCATALVDAAVAAGSKDDISVVLGEYSGPSNWLPSFTSKIPLGVWLAVAGGVILGAALALVLYLTEYRK